jgi:hypothetical protein
MVKNEHIHHKWINLTFHSFHVETTNIYILKMTPESQIVIIYKHIAKNSITYLSPNPKE